MAVDKKISYEVQGGVKNYLGKQKEVTAPVKWKSSPDHPETELAYITKAEKDLLVKKDLHGSLKGGVNRGPSGIMSLNGYGSKDPNQNVSGSQISAAETGSAGSGMSAKDRDDFRSAAIAAGAGQRVNPGFFDDRNTVSPAELARAKQFSPNAFSAGRRGGIMDFFTGGGFLGNIIRGLGQKFGLGKSFNAPYDRPQFAPGFAANTMTIGNDLDNRFALANTTNQIPVVIDDDMSLIPRISESDMSMVGGPSDEIRRVNESDMSLVGLSAIDQDLGNPEQILKNIVDKVESGQTLSNDEQLALDRAIFQIGGS